MAVVWDRLRGHVFEAAVAAANLLVGIAWLTVPALGQHSAVGRSVHPLDYVWSVFYVVGGGTVLVSLLSGDRLPLRIAGLTLLSSGLVMQGVAAASYHLEPRVLTFFVYAIACALRAVVCARQITARRR